MWLRIDVVLAVVVVGAVPQSHSHSVSIETRVDSRLRPVVLFHMMRRVCMPSKMTIQSSIVLQHRVEQQHRWVAWRNCFVFWLALPDRGGAPRCSRSRRFGAHRKILH